MNIEKTKSQTPVYFVDMDAGDVFTLGTNDLDIYIKTTAFVSNAVNLITGRGKTFPDDYKVYPQHQAKLIY